MCCFLTILMFLGPRFATIVWYIAEPTRFALAFNGFLLPCLGFVFLPWTLLMYLAIWVPGVGVQGFGWVLLGLSFLVDIGTYAGGGYGNRNRLPARS